MQGGVEAEFRKYSETPMGALQSLETLTRAYHTPIASTDTSLGCVLSSQQSSYFSVWRIRIEILLPDPDLKIIAEKFRKIRYCTYLNGLQRFSKFLFKFSKNMRSLFRVSVIFLLDPDYIDPRIRNPAVSPHLSLLAIPCILVNP